MRSLLRNLQSGWQFSRIRWQVNSKGVGVAVYLATGPKYSYSLVCFAHDLPPEKRSDRVIATAWDATFTFMDGIPSDDDIRRLEEQVPKQEAGHCSQKELVLARANRSVRLFEHVIDSLARGQQPDAELIDTVGYLMRTTAVYGNGKFGVSDRERIADRPEFVCAFHVELFAVWMIRWFTVDIVEHLAYQAGGESASTLDRNLRRKLGVGNSTGLGMAPFLVLHPVLIHKWIMARETALARVRSLGFSSSTTRKQFSMLVSRMMLGVESWNTVDVRQQNRIHILKRDLLKLTARVKSPGLAIPFPWDNIVCWSEQNLSIEGQELLVTLVIEPHGWLVDDLAASMNVDETHCFNIYGAMTMLMLKKQIDENYQWALEIDYDQFEHSARFWYYSEEKLEPRVGERYLELGAEKEYPMAYGRDIKLLSQALEKFLENHDHNDRLASFLIEHPEHRHSVRRVQLTTQFRYAEIRDNLISADMMPIDLLRCKLSFFGANRFDPRSDRWVRVNMFQFAPFPDEIQKSGSDDWIYAPLP